MATPVMITVYGQMFEQPADPDATASVTFLRPHFVTHSDGSVIEPGSLRVEVDPTDGTFSLEVMATDDPEWTPVGWTYEVTLFDGVRRWRYAAVIPYNAPGGTLSIGDILPALSASSGVLYAAYGHTHAGYVTEAELADAIEGVEGGGSGGGVVSVNGDAGPVVSLDAADVGAASMVHTHPDEFEAIGTLQEQATHFVTYANADLYYAPKDGTQTALDAKAPLASPTFTGTVAGISKGMVGLGNVANVAQIESSQANLDLLYGLVIPTDHNLIGWTFDPTQVQGGLVLATAGTMYTARVRLLRSTITNVNFHFTAAGATLTAGQCFAAVYSDAGLLLGTTGDQATNWAASGYKTCVLSAPLTGLTPYTWVRVAWWFNGTTGPTLSRGVNSASAIVNAGMASGFRFATANTGITTTPPGTLGTLNGGATGWWVGLS